MNEVEKRWFKERTTAIHESITAFDVLRANGVDLSQGADDREEQFSCPFHGEDKKPSARIYPDREDNPSHVWCFVCQEPGWDAIGLWRKFNNLTFGQALHRLEREFGLTTPEVPDGAFEEPEEEGGRDAFKRTYVACEARLVSSKAAYRAQADMRGYLNVGSILDRTRFQVDNDLWTPERGILILQALLDRIHAKTKACPGG